MACQAFVSSHAQANPAKTQASRQPPPRATELHRITRGSVLLELQQEATASERLANRDAALPVQAMGAFHLTKGIVGTGWLSIPSGVVTLASSLGESWALTLALLLLVGIAGVSAYTYKEVATIAAQTGSASFAEAFDRSKAGSSSLAAWTAALNCLGGCVSFAMILGDSTVGLLSQAVADEAGTAGLDPELRLPIRFLAVVASCGLMWPACSKLDMSSMGWSSLLGVAATLVTAAAMVVRLFDGSYTQPAGQFVGAVNSGGTATAASEPGPLGAAGAVLTLASLLANSFIAHQCAPQLRQAVQRDLEAASPGRGRNSEGIFDGVVRAGFVISSFLYATITACAFLTFGMDAKGNILDSYAANDPLAGAARLATVVCVVCSFPQMLLGLRDSLKHLTGGCKELEAFVSTPSLLAAIALLAGIFTDLSSVMAVQGAVLGALIVYILPGLMVWGRERSPSKESTGLRPHHALLAIGATIGVGGVGTALLGTAGSVN